MTLTLGVAEVPNQKVGLTHPNKPTAHQPSTDVGLTRYMLQPSYAQQVHPSPHCTSYLTSRVDGVTDSGMEAKKPLRPTKAKKKLFAQDTLDLVNLHSSSTENGFMMGIRDRLDISSANHAIGQPSIFVIYFSIGGSSGGVTTHFGVDHREIIENLNGSDSSKLAKLLDTRAITAAHEMIDHILETGAKQLAWNRASRWQRLKWAWKGIIQPSS